MIREIIINNKAYRNKIIIVILNLKLCNKTQAKVNINNFFTRIHLNRFINFNLNLIM